MNLDNFTASKSQFLLAQWHTLARCIRDEKHDVQRERLIKDQEDVKRELVELHGEQKADRLIRDYHGGFYV